MNVLPLLQDLDPNLSAEQKKALKDRLAIYLNDLLLHDFHALVQLLYRVDVPEKKLKATLKENPTEDAGHLLAELLIQRQLEKKAVKNSFQFPPGESEEERW